MGELMKSSLHNDLSLVYRTIDAPERGAPLLVLLHGVGSNERALLGLSTRFPDLFLVSARAPIALSEDRFAWFHVNFTPEPVHNLAEAEASRQTLLTFLGELAKRYGVLRKDIYLLGFSQGAILSLSVALSAPRNVAGVVAMSGRILQEISANLTPSPDHRNLPILVTHGVQDGKLPIYHAHASKAILESLSVDLTYREYPVGHELSEANVHDAGVWLGQHRHDGERPNNGDF